MWVTQTGPQRLLQRLHAVIALLFVNSNVLHTVSNFRRAAYARNASTARTAGPWLHECQNCETTSDESSRACVGGGKCCMTVQVWS